MGVLVVFHIYLFLSVCVVENVSIEIVELSFDRMWSQKLLTIFNENAVCINTYKSPKKTVVVPTRTNPSFQVNLDEREKDVHNMICYKSDSLL